MICNICIFHLISLRDIISINGLSLMLKIIDQCDVKSIMLFIWDFLTHIKNIISLCNHIHNCRQVLYLFLHILGMVWYISWYMGTVNSCKNMPSCIYLDLLRRSPWNTDVSRWQKKNIYFTAWCHMINEKEHLISANKSVLFQFFPIYSI